MAYLGRGIENLSDRVVLDSLTASATASYTLQLNSVNFVPSSAESLTVSLNGVIQAPISSYTVSGSTLTFASTLSASDSIDFIIAERGITLQTPSAGSVGTSQLASNAVTAAKINDGEITNAKISSTAGIATSKLGTGAVLQVVYDTLDTNYGTSSSTFSDTGLTLNITPSSTSNKILIMLNGGSWYNNNNANALAWCTFYRDSTNLEPTSNGGFEQHYCNAWFSYPHSASYLDSPSTTSQITYKLAWSINSDTHYLGRRGFDTGHDAPTILTAMEIAG